MLYIKFCTREYLFCILLFDYNKRVTKYVFLFRQYNEQRCVWIIIFDILSAIARRVRRHVSFLVNVINSIIIIFEHFHAVIFRAQSHGTIRYSRITLAVKVIRTRNAIAPYVLLAVCALVEGSNYSSSLWGPTSNIPHMARFNLRWDSPWQTSRP